MSKELFDYLNTYFDKCGTFAMISIPFGYSVEICSYNISLDYLIKTNIESIVGGKDNE